jgi:uncharacterized membrane-anchored protein
MATLVAIVGNLLVLAIFNALFEIPPTLPAFAVVPVIIVTVIGVLGAALVFALIARYTRRPIRIFQITSLVVLLVSFIPNIGMFTREDASVPGIIGLMIMHVVAAAAAVGIMTKAVQGDTG